RGQGEINNRELGNYCPPMYFIDGVYYPLPPLQTQSVPVVPSEILGIEVYSNLFSAPPQFQRRGSGCGVVLIWTKRGTPRRRASQCRTAVVVGSLKRLHICARQSVLLAASIQERH